MTTRYLSDAHIERQAIRLLNRHEREFEAVTEPPTANFTLHCRNITAKRD